MKQLLENFDKELVDGLAIASQTKFTNTNVKIKNIVISGLGGSGIGGSIAYSLLANKLHVPYYVNKGYFLPNCINENTLVIICSYSGNTEESIHAFKEAMHKNAIIVCITSGGELANLAINCNYNHVLIPSGRPPRASLGYSLIQLIATLVKYQVIADDILATIYQTSEFINANKTTIIEESLQLSQAIYDKLPVIYCEETIEPIAIRWKQQLNENSKMLCWHNVYPEMNHNELVGWREVNNQLALIIIKTGDEYYRNQARMDLNELIYKKVTNSITHIHAKGNNQIEKAFYLIHYGDWLSYHLAIKRGYDPMEIDVLIKLKNDLSNIK